MKSIYDQPRYYEIAFSFRDIPSEVDTFEKCFEMYAGLPVKSVLEVGCGNCPHMVELLRRGYTFTGLDISEAMLAYSARKANSFAGKATFIQADMVDFSLSKRFDFAYIMLGSLSVQTTEDIFSHFRSVAQVLNPGALYLLDWCIKFAPFSDQEDSWSMTQDDIKVTTRISEKTIDVVGQLVEETISLEVVDHGRVLNFSGTGVSRVIFPQEFLQIIQQTEGFEFVGWWNNWNLDRPLREFQDPQAINRPITLLRKL
jgi:SAM-dependent methyltransferase